jgi:exosortase
MSRTESLMAVSGAAERRQAASSAAVGRAASWLALVGVAAAIGLLFAPEFAAWWREWRKPDGYYTHGPVVPLLVAVLIWIDWDRLKRVAPGPSLAGLLFVLPALCLLTLSRWSHVFFLSGFAWLLLIPGAIWLIQGAGMARALLGPIGLMFFQLPMPAEVIEPVSVPIQEVSTAWATRCLTWMHVPAVRDGTLIHLPRFTMDIGIECSGYKLMVALLMFGFFLAAAHRGAWWRKALLVLFGIPLAAVVNATRITLAGVLGQWIDPQASRVFHDYAGIFVWSASFAGLYLAMTALRCNQLKGTASS